MKRIKDYGQITIFFVGCLLLFIGFSTKAYSKTIAEQYYRTAEIAQFELESFQRISNQLGFASFAYYEDNQLRALFQRALVAYFRVFKAQDRIWSTRSAYRIAELVENFYQKQILDYTPPFRYFSLPSPIAIHVTKTSSLSLNQKIRALGNEIKLLYETIDSNAKKLNQDKELQKDLQVKLKAIKALQIPVEEVASPFLAKPKPGFLKDKNGHIVQLQKNGTWKHISALDLKPIQDALNHSEYPVRLSGILMAELHPTSELIPHLLSCWKKNTQLNNLKTNSLFSNLQTTLFGEQERILFALKANLQKDPNSIHLVMAANNLPVIEKSWLLYFAPKNKQSLQLAKNLAESKEAITAARALWILHQNNPKTAQHLIKQRLTAKS